MSRICYFPDDGSILLSVYPIFYPVTDCNNLGGGQNAENDCSQKDIGDIIRKGNKDPKPPWKIMLLVLPNSSYIPVNGFMIGLTGAASFYHGDKEKTRSSTIGFNAAYTTRNQFITNMKSSIYTCNSQFFLHGD